MIYYIYCIWVKTEYRVLRYYGYTKNMRVRKGKHVKEHQAWIKAGKPDKTGEAHATRSVFVLDHEDWRMDVVYTIESEDNADARAKEGEFILENDCVNMRLEGRGMTKQEYVNLYYQEHKDEISTKHKEKMTCEVCGSVVRKCAIERHRKTKKCLNALATGNKIST